jgi:transposase
MRPETSLFTMALGLQAPWSVTDMRCDTKVKEIHFQVRFKPGTRLACPTCGAPDQQVHDTRPRSCEHLRFFEHKAFIHACVPRVACTQCSKTGQLSVHWN